MYSTTARSRPRGSAPSRPRSAGGVPGRAGSGGRPGRWPATRRQDVPGAAGRQFGIHRPHRGPEVREFRPSSGGNTPAPGRGRTPRRRPARPAPAPGRCSSELLVPLQRQWPGCRPARPKSSRRGAVRAASPPHTAGPIPPAAGAQDERVMGQGGPLEFGVGQVAKPGRLQAGPPEPAETRGGRFDRDERVILEGSE